MTTEQIQLIRSSWEAISAIKHEAGQLFYKKLFRLAPEVQPLFQGNMHMQANKLMQVMDYVVEHLEDMENLIPVIRELGSRHEGYGAKPSHYEIVGICLLETLRESLTGIWAPELNDAWTIAYYRIKQVMIIAQEKKSTSVSGTASND